MILESKRNCEVELGHRNGCRGDARFGDVLQVRADLGEIFENHGGGSGRLNESVRVSGRASDRDGLIARAGWGARRLPGELAGTVTDSLLQLGRR